MEILILLSLFLQQPIQQEMIGSTAKNASLSEFLQNYVGNPPSDRNKTARYLDASVDLNDDGNDEIIVYLIANDWCGSGGCFTLILDTRGATYKVISEIMVTHPPIRMLTNTSNGWHSLSVLVRGGGILKPYEVELSFNGKTYPGSPSDQAARILDKASGKIVIADDFRIAKPIFP
jgi:hypothetical protein